VFKGLPQNIFAFLTLVLALGLIFILRKPHSVCDSQAEIFKTNQTPFLYLDPKGTSKTRDFVKFIDFCKLSNSPGGCLEFFDGMKRLYSDLIDVPSGCTPVLIDSPEVKEALFAGLELIVRLAWGEKPPSSNLERNGWLDLSQVAVFCNFKKMMIEQLGSDVWSSFVEKQMSNLPGASLLPRNDVWGRSLLSDPCVSY